MKHSKHMDDFRFFTPLNIHYMRWLWRYILLFSFICASLKINIKDWTSRECTDFKLKIKWRVFVHFDMFILICGLRVKCYWIIWLLRWLNVLPSKVVTSFLCRSEYLMTHDTSFFDVSFGVWSDNHHQFIFLCLTHSLSFSLPPSLFLFLFIFISLRVSVSISFILRSTSWKYQGESFAAFSFCSFNPFNSQNRLQPTSITKGIHGLIYSELQA